jgi:hypothetical protein
MCGHALPPRDFVRFARGAPARRLWIRFATVEHRAVGDAWGGTELHRHRRVRSDHRIDESLFQRRVLLVLQ